MICSRPLSRVLLLCLAGVLLAGGLYFRCDRLGQPVYWVDEVATSMRISGYTHAEVAATLSGTSHSAADLLFFQQPHPQKTWTDTLAVLARSPEHAPLYFLLARGWVLCFGSTVTAIRSLSVGLGLLAIPCTYWLGWELFRQGPVALTGAVLLALSPFFVSYAREARPYSLLLVVLLLLQGSLLRAYRRDRPRQWAIYGLCVAASCYTSLLCVGVCLGQGLFLFVATRPTRRLRRYLLALGGGFLAFSPWLLVVALNWDALQANTTWAREPIAAASRVPIWVYNLSVVFLDIPVSAQTRSWLPVAFVLALLVIALIGYACWELLQAPLPAGTTRLLLATILTVPGLLLVADTVASEQLSTPARYFLPTHVGILLAVAYLLRAKLAGQPSLAARRFWGSVAVLMLVASLFSCWTHRYQEPRYQKSRNLHNRPIAAIVNREPAAEVLGTPRAILDLISLSYALDPDVRVAILPPEELLAAAKTNACRGPFLFDPPAEVLTAIDRLPVRAVARYEPQRLVEFELALALWQIRPPDELACQERPSVEAPRKERVYVRKDPAIRPAS